MYARYDENNQPLPYTLEEVLETMPDDNVVSIFDEDQGTLFSEGVIDLNNMTAHSHIGQVDVKLDDKEGVFILA